VNRVSDRYLCWLEKRQRVTSTKYKFQNGQKPEIQNWTKLDLCLVKHSTLKHRTLNPRYVIAVCAKKRKVCCQKASSDIFCITFFLLKCLLHGKVTRGKSHVVQLSIRSGVQRKTNHLSQSLDPRGNWLSKICLQHISRRRRCIQKKFPPQSAKVQGAYMDGASFFWRLFHRASLDF
jgi:hypothetical protein